MCSSLFCKGCRKVKKSIKVYFDRKFFEFFKMKRKALYILVFTYSFIFAQKIEIPRTYRQGKVAEHLKNDKDRLDDSPLLSIESYRANSDFILDEAIIEIETDDLFDGCVIFVSPRSLKDFYYKVLPFVDKKVIIVSNGGAAFQLNTGLDWDKYYTSKEYMSPKFASHPNVLALFAKNEIYDHPKCFPIPIGKSDLFPLQSKIIKELSLGLTIEDFFKDKEIKVYVNLGNTHKSRSIIINHFKKIKCAYISKRKSFTNYFKDMQNSKFIISPRGYGLDAFRTWEGLYAGSIPVVQSCGLDSMYEGLPVIIVDDLSSLTIDDLEIEYEKLKDKNFDLNRLFINYWMNKMRSHKNTI